MTLQQISAEYRGYRNAGIRMSEDFWIEGMFTARRIRRTPLNWILDFDKAHLVMLVETGLIDTERGAEMLHEVLSVESDDDLLGEWDGGVHWTEKQLIRRLGEQVGGWLNLGRSTGDLSEVARRSNTRHLVLENIDALNRLRSVLLGLASQFAEIVVPGQTFLQHAQPTTLGHWLGMWAAVLGRDVERYTQTLSRVNESPAGAAILSTTDFEIDRRRVSTLLGFDRPIANSLDAIMSHDVGLETMSAMTISAMNLARIADDLELWLSTEYRYVNFPDRFCGSSSIMPQKRNPNIPQQIKAQSVKAIGAMSMGIASERGATGQPMLERFESDNVLWELLEDLPLVMGDLGTMMETIEVDGDRMQRSSEQHWASASDLASLIVTESGLSWRTAHQICGIVIRICEERELSPADLTPEIVDDAARMYHGEPLVLSRSSLRAALDPVAAVHRRTVLGGSAPSEVRHQIQSMIDRLDDDVRAASGWHSRIDDAHVLLTEAIERILAEK
ncbi:argininosuccinate lyase [Rhodococcoides fascians]|uniref:argininosuccinate lyase n=1 Tax=Rhodococcoides fascians TaxID=1828 RepID=UPI000568CE62|nr:argininosuccinate lyase [Rhodococcus fascians]